MPAGADDTVPAPEPALTTVSTGFNAKFALTLLAASTATTQVAPDAWQGPDQLARYESCCGFAVSVTTVPEPNGALQVVGQLMPAGLDESVPKPAPEIEVASVKLAPNSAVTAAYFCKLIVQGLVCPAHAPSQRENVPAPPPDAVNVTAVPLL